MFPGTWGCPRHVRFACHTSSMHIQSTKAKSKHQKLQYLFLISSKFFMVSKFNIYTVHLKCFESIRYHLNQYKTLTKNFNQGLNSGELMWKMVQTPKTALIKNKIHLNLSWYQSSTSILSIWSVLIASGII